MFPFLIKAKNVFLDILFPPICLNCQKYLNALADADLTRTNAKNTFNKILCDSCYSSIKINNTLFCPVCRARLANNEKICHFNSPYLLAAATNYDDPVIQNLIHYFKYKGLENLSPILGEILIKYLEDIFRNSKFIIHNSILVPIPLHFWREKQRGFNQSKLLAKNIANHYNIPLVENLKRIKNTDPQAKSKNSEERIKNISGCFEVKNSESIAGKNVILIDDVFTSGATMDEAVKILKKNGAKKIIALIMAKV